jgi:CRISPR-associated exonuclease Cas4
VPRASALRPLCEAVDCGVQLSLREALLFFRQLGDEAFLFLPGPPASIYAREWKEIRVWPSMVGDYLFCPRLLWVQARLGLRLMTAAAVTAAARGVELHRRYAEWLRRQGAMAPVRIDAGWLAAEIDAVIELDGYLVPVEVKSAIKKRLSHELQLQAYMWLLNAPRGYLVYPRGVEEVAPSPRAREMLYSIDRAINDARPPPPGRDCGRCAYREACALAVPAAEELLAGAGRRAFAWGETELA